jgi:lambda repressor-like predicted transcriptional regulator
MPTALHPEDIKAALRKRHGSVVAFELARGLPAQSVKDVFSRRRPRRNAVEAVAEELGVAPQQIDPHFKSDSQAAVNTRVTARNQIAPSGAR